MHVQKTAADLTVRLALGLTLGLTLAQVGACGDEDKKKTRGLGTDVNSGRDGDPEGDEASEGFRDLDGGIDVSARDGATAGPVDAAPPKHCDVTHPDLGCGVGDASWVSYDRGAQIDTRTGTGWIAVELSEEERKGHPDDALDKKCRALTVPGLGKLRIPEIEDVRAWAAGCAKTEPAGSCTVKSDRPNASEAASCLCDPLPPPARGPHASGGFCRPEIPDCDTLWVATFCHPHDCVSHTHWFYDVNSGSVVLGDYSSEIAKRAKSYCVTDEPLALVPR